PDRQHLEDERQVRQLLLPDQDPEEHIQHGGGRDRVRRREPPGRSVELRSRARAGDPRDDVRQQGRPREGAQRRERSVAGNRRGVLPYRLPPGRDRLLQVKRRVEKVGAPIGKAFWLAAQAARRGGTVQTEVERCLEEITLSSRSARRS